ncbi:hypothetical protein D7X74_30445 [Corallococcus sp. CA047B]|uniref:hypothetical protein n=1 Tax=Corallococcus sp. CA047B TaxID=2316729 RepID=UPI000EA180A1|nr:hypothetical protein [Corallococcus sp. CA047B]RKH09004.1 hypothetical protein D7X74_30445 [Corallococcus sp. CA047B]
MNKTPVYAPSPALSERDALVDAIERAVDAALSGRAADTRLQAMGVIRRFRSTASEQLWTEDVRARLETERLVRDAALEEAELLVADFAARGDNSVRMAQGHGWDNVERLSGRAAAFREMTESIHDLRSKPAPSEGTR